MKTNKQATTKSVIEDLYPLSPMQQGMLFHTLYDPQSRAYFEQLRYALRGEFEVQAFKHAWQQMIERHAVLRTAFVWDDLDKPLQVVRDRVTLPWTERDWRDLSEQEQQEHVESFLENDRQRGFRLERAPLFRLALIRLSQQGQEVIQFVWSFHHALLDGWSVALLLQELFACYESYRQGGAALTPGTLPAPSASLAPRPYRDYISWLQGQDQRQAEHYWRALLAGFTAPTRLDIDISTSKNTGKKYEQKIVHTQQQLLCSQDMLTELRAFAQQQQLTLNTLVQGAWALLLSRYSGEHDVVFGAVTSGRPEVLHGSESMIGLFIATLPMRVQIPLQQKLLPWLKALQKQQVETRNFEYSSLVDIQRWSDVDADLPLFENIVVFENYPADSEAFERRLSLSIEGLTDNEYTSYPLTLAVLPEHGLELHIIYDTNRFSDEHMQRMLLQLEKLLQEIVAHPTSSISDLAILTAQDYQDMIIERNATVVPIATTETLPDLFETRVQRTPDAIALAFQDQQYSYRELNEQANRLAHELQKHHVGPDVLVGVCCQRSPEMVIALLATLKAGGAYVPLDPAHPKARLEFIIQDTQLSLIIVQEEVRERVAAPSCSVLAIDTFLQGSKETDLANPARELHPEHLAYVIYTSGSTGRPKGAAMRHAGVCNIVRAQEHTLGSGSGSRIAQFASFNFDASVWEILSPLTRGGTLYVDTREALAPGTPLLELLDRQAITLAALTPSVLSVLPEGAVPTLRTLITSGEPCTEELVKRWGKGRSLHNAYGPTETTVYSTIALNVSEASELSIGLPVANTQIYLLDRHMQPVPAGVRGEIYLSGAGLARGYLKQPALTAERFLPNPFSTQPGARLYRTGDIAFSTLDGQIKFVGRNDHQLKIRGLRIEPAEIEAALHQHPTVQQCAVVGQEDASGEKHLVAYVHSKADQQAHPSILRHYLQEVLPSYMVPDRFLLLDELPRTPSGKLDTRKLPALDEQQAQSEKRMQEPGDLLELQLLQAYEEVLQVRPIGVTDDFFVLGGHSLSAVRLVSEIKKRLAVSITLPMLFQASTVAQLATLLRQQQNVPDQQHSPLVALRDQGQGNPLFCIHPANGHIVCYHRLVQYLAPDQACYGLQDLDIHNDEIAQRSIEEIANAYLAAMRQVQPVGPYLLAGYSFGCIVAFEIAQQLRRAGQEVALLALIDGSSPAKAGKVSTEDADLLTIILVEWLRGTTKKSWYDIYNALSPLTAEQQITYALELLKEGQINLLSADPHWLKRQVQLFKSRLSAAQRYKPEIYDGQLTVFVSSHVETSPHVTDEMSDADDLGWHHYTTKSPDLHLLPGYHETLLREPYVQALAALLQERLKQAQTPANRQ